MVDVRPATLKDVPRLSELFRQEFEYQTRFDRAVQPNSDGDWRGFVSGRLALRNVLILVAEEEGHILGYINVRVVQQGQGSKIGGLKAIAKRMVHPFQRELESIIQPRRFGVIEDVYIEPPMRKQGMATELFQRSLQWFKGHQVNEVEATIGVDNEASREYFRNLGFETVRVLVRKPL